MHGLITPTCSAAELLTGLESVMRGDQFIPTVIAENLALRDEAHVLTDREFEVLCEISRGLCNKRIAMQLGIEVDTVKAHVGGVLRKLKAFRVRF